MYIVHCTILYIVQASVTRVQIHGSYSRVYNNKKTK